MHFAVVVAGKNIRTQIGTPNYRLGGRWSGVFKTKDGELINFAKKKEIYLDALRDANGLLKFPAYAFIKDGQWSKQGSIGFLDTTPEKPAEEWAKELTSMIDSLLENTQLTLVDLRM